MNIIAAALAVLGATVLLAWPVAARAADAPVARAAADEAFPGSYRLQPGDVLHISVWKEPDLIGEALIRPDGALSFPLAGEIQAAERTIGELRAELESRIRKYVPEAVITVSVRALAGNRIYVIGKIARPGDFPLIRPTDVIQALALAGGPTPFADLNDIRILRRGGGGQKVLAFRYGDVERGRRLEQNVLLQPGDTVIVP